MRHAQFVVFWLLVPIVFVIEAAWVSDGLFRPYGELRKVLSEVPDSAQVVGYFPRSTFDGAFIVWNMSISDVDAAELKKQCKEPSVIFTAIELRSKVSEVAGDGPKPEGVSVARGRSACVVGRFRGDQQTEIYAVLDANLIQLTFSAR